MYTINIDTSSEYCAPDSKLNVQAIAIVLNVTISKTCYQNDYPC